MMLFALAFAQETAQVAPKPNALMQFLPLLVIGVIFYFLMIRPQKKRFEKEKSYLSSLQKGDEVYTKSGMIGTIVGLNDQVATLEISEGVKMKILRNQIGGSAKSITESTTSAQA
ncbi:MAG: preprotein translocase subunit YajC [Bacteriovoracaceae bacterium]|nr:preprotein translocase subunit YajC [Bacteriovoracaceae bacterium]